MGRLLWATDVHLDHVGHPAAAREFGAALRREQHDAEGLLVTGDIGEAPTIADILTDLQAGFAGPLYFVLGNHDYYRGSFESVDSHVRTRFTDNQNIHWLRTRARSLSDAVILLGNGGWYDAGYGDRRSDLQLNDFRRIEELFEAQDTSRNELLMRLEVRADQLARELSQQLERALSAGPSCVLVATHVPPFQEAAWHQGQPSDARWAPFFSSRATGRVLLAHAGRHPQTQFVVLCGHTHGAGVYQPKSNLVVHTGRAQYGAPDLAAFIDVEPRHVHITNLGLEQLSA